MKINVDFVDYGGVEVLPAYDTCSIPGYLPDPNLTPQDHAQIN